MYSLRKFLLAAGCCLLVAGCAATEEEKGEVVYYNGETANLAMTYPEMAREVSGGSVEIYGLDGPAMPIVAPAAPSPLGLPVPMEDGGVIAGADPNVTVYPLDGGGVPMPQAMRPALMPPSDVYRPLQAPFGGPLQTNVPVNMPPPPPASPAPEHTSRIYFGHGSSALNSEGRQVAGYAAQSGGVITVDGHASRRAETSDPVERQIVNLKVSMDRAYKVSSELIRKGVPVEMIETRAYGDSHPAAPIPGVDEDAASRRVEIATQGGSVYTAPPAAPGEAPIPPLARY